MSTAERLTVVMAEIRAKGSAENREGMSRYGINTAACLRRLGVRVAAHGEAARRGPRARPGPMGHRQP